MYDSRLKEFILNKIILEKIKVIIIDLAKVAVKDAATNVATYVALSTVNYAIDYLFPNSKKKEPIFLR